jgi:L-threonylcarbamoyladenylate synthase
MAVEEKPGTGGKIGGMIVPADAAGIARAAEIVIAGGVVVFPTDTVYGLACDLRNADAVARVYQIKGRPARMPLIAMIADAEAWPSVAAAAPHGAKALMRRWWPGPLTLILPAGPDIPDLVLGGGATLGVRIPDHPAALALLRAAGRPLATTSANRSGAPAALTASEAADQLGDAVDLILDAGLSPVGQASTVLDCTVDPPRILREGPVTGSMLGLT